VSVSGEGTTIVQRAQQLVNVQSGSGYGRLQVLWLVLDDWQRNPLAGLGNGSFNGHLPGVPPSAHVWIYSMGLAILHDSGVVGVVLFAWFLVEVCLTLFRAIRSTNEPALQALGIGALGAATCMLFGAQTTSSMYLMLLWVFVGLAGAVPALVTRFRLRDPELQTSARKAASTLIPTGDSSGPGVSGEEPTAALDVEEMDRTVLHVYDNGDLGGMQRVLLVTARGLKDYGWQCTAICGDNGPLAENLMRAGVTAEALTIGNKHRFVRALPQLVRYIRRQRPSGVIVYGAIVGCVGGLAARLAGVPCVVYQTGSPAYYYSWDARRRLRNAFVERIACACSDIVWCISVGNRDLYRAHKATRPDKLRLVPLCVPHEVLEQIHDQEEQPDQSPGRAPQLSISVGLLQGLGWERAAPIIGFVGRLAHVKGVDVLLRAYQGIIQLLPDARLLIVGDGPEQNSLMQLANDLGISAGVAFIGAQEDVVPYYLLADVIAQPSRHEEGGFVALEAMAAGRPVVATRVSGFIDSVVDGACGRLVPPEDPAALAEALLWVLHSKDHARQLGAQARERTLAEYSEDTMIGAVSQLLQIGLRARMLD
jgi:glycosyltransferase involved in cell wall biosynthesis